MEKIAAAIVLYHPTSEFFDNIISYTPHVDKIFVIDNTPGNNDTNEEKIINLFPHAVYVANKTNLGIAKALNIACIQAIWLLTMDQGSAFENFSEYLNYFSKLEHKDDIAIISNFIP